MRLRGFFWRIFPPLLTLALLSILLSSWHATRSLRAFHLREAAADLRDRAVLLRGPVADLLSAGRLDSLQALVEGLGGLTATRITVIDPAGVVLADSDEDPALMENHAGRPEVAAALAGRVGESRRHSRTLGVNMLYVAVPLQPGAVGTPEPAGPAAPSGPAGGAVAVAVVRTAVPLADLEAAVGGVRSRILLGGLVLALLAGLVAWAVGRRLSRPLRELQAGAERFAAGELDRRLPAPDSEETGALADALNRMAAALNDRIAAVEAQRRELEAVLGSMMEGVLAVDDQERIISLNRAGADLLGVERERALGRTVPEIVRNPDLQRLVGQALERPGPAERDLVLHGDRELHLQAHATGLCGEGGRRLGVLLVLNDVTRLRRLESLRRDFVANVSHELKTPITSIKGFVETLLDGALAEPAEARRFLEIVAAQADRLQAIVEDLLALSRIEQESESEQIQLHRAFLRPVLERALEAGRPRAEAQRIAVTLDCPDDLVARCNETLLEQAVGNLLDNAIKYSEPGTAVAVTATAHGGTVEIAVRDHGRGIAPEHLPRLFERFYRVDKARSRKYGGTGLGLAIVKHIAQAHGGRVEVESVPGEGSTFRLALPAA